MKRKSAKAERFVSDLHGFLVGHPQFRKNTAGRKEREIQTELRPLIVQYLHKVFESDGVVDAIGRAHDSFYWEGQEGQYVQQRPPLFGIRNYPDFIITRPYRIAVEYKQSESGTLVKHGIGQSIVHTLSGEYDYVYLLLCDQNSDKRIAHSVQQELEKSIIDRMWQDFNVFIRII